MSVRWKHRVEYGLLRGIAGLFQILPYRVALGLGWGLAWTGHFVVRFRTREARQRLRQVLGPDRPEREIRHLAWRAFRNLAFNVVDIARLGHTDPEEARRTTAFDPDGLTRLLDHIRTGRGAVLAIPHMGNWERAAAVAHQLGMPLFYIARRQKNPLADAWLNRLRETTGGDVVLNDSRVLQNVVRRLKAGQMVAMLPDVRNPTPALAIPFLGGTANLGAGTALFARMARVPILWCFATREGWTRHRIHGLKFVWPDPEADRDEDLARMTSEVMARFDQAIREHPDQYFWFNKRWVLDPLSPTPPSPPPD